MNHKVLILGGGYAGMIAAARIGKRANVILIDARPEFVQRIRLHELLAGGAPQTLGFARWLGRRGVRFVQARAESLEPGRQRVLARREDGHRVELGYDTLILALGSATASGVPESPKTPSAWTIPPRSTRRPPGCAPSPARAAGRSWWAAGSPASRPLPSSPSAIRACASRSPPAAGWGRDTRRLERSICAGA